MYTFRRGTVPAAVHSLAFSPSQCGPYLAALSAHGTLHLFVMEPGRWAPQSMPLDCAWPLMPLPILALPPVCMPESDYLQIRPAGVADGWMH